MNKKKYVAPIIEKYGVLLSSFMAGSLPTSEVDKKEGPSGVVDKTDGDESDAKNFNAWSSWDE